jgi:polyketide cyclase/dehydrase/lipid transport protein
MVIIQVAREILSPLDKVWDIVSDIDNEPLYWHGTKYVKNISKIGNVVEREVVIAFRESKCKETVVLNPKKMVKVNITNGPLEGSKIITLDSTGPNNTTVYVKWDIRLSGFMRMFTVFIKKHIREGTEEALSRTASKTDRESDDRLI